MRSKSSRTQTAPASANGAASYVSLRVELPADIAARLEASAREHSRYKSAGDVAAECVTLYLPLLEALDSRTAEIRKEVIAKRLREVGG
jgi:hypothetical protein